MSKEMKNFLNVGIYVLNIFLAVVFAYGYFRSGDTNAAWWAVIAALWIIHSFTGDILTRQYKEVTEHLIITLSKLSNHIDELHKKIETNDKL